jgi:hypothetical protein
MQKYDDAKIISLGIPDTGLEELHVSSPVYHTKKGEKQTKPNQTKNNKQNKTKSPN